MGFIVFEKHPGDLLKTTFVKKKSINFIEINRFNLRVIKIKLTANWTFKVYFDLLSDNINLSILLSVLNGMLQEHHILDYELEDKFLLK